MKKAVTSLLVAGLAVGIWGCGNGEPQPEPNQGTQPPEQNQQDPLSPPGDEPGGAPGGDGGLGGGSTPGGGGDTP